MTQEEKAKLYDELKVKAQELAEDGYIDKLALVDMFPELKKSRDEMIRQLLISFVKYDMPDNYSDDISKEECLAWLEKQCEKGTKGNEREIPNSTWSEEDANMLNRLILHFDWTEYYGFNKSDCDAAQKWLKSIRPQKQWKPSDEQIKALNYVVNLMASSERPTENDLYYNILKSLRQQLKKLREE